MRFFTYRQNNSRGRYDENLPKVLIVEAATVGEAERVAEGLGVYFDGVAKGPDCVCCGDRWQRAEEGSVVPNCWPSTPFESVLTETGAIEVGIQHTPLWIVYADGSKDTCGGWGWTKYEG